VSDDTSAAPPAHQAGAVTFRDVFGVGEYRAIFLALVANSVGDYLARAAMTVLVYQQTRSVLLSAASFAISYLPWIVGGPLLAALAERYPYRRVMIVCDLLRMGFVGLVAVPGLPVAAVLALALLGMLTSPPTQAARSALLPLVLGRDRVVVALAVNATTTQGAQVVGFLVGATVAAASSARLTIAGVALLFGLSALIIASGVTEWPAADSTGHRSHLLRETAEGFRLVFGSTVLRPIAVLVFTVTMFAIVPEGLAAGWAAELGPDPARRGFDQGVIMAAGPVGWIIGGLLISRLVPPDIRQRLVRPLSIAAALALVPVLAAPDVPVIALFILISGIAQGGIMPTLNGLFVLALAHGYRARAFGVMQGGLQISQGCAVLLTGFIAEHVGVPVTVGLWSVAGALTLVALAAQWPRPAAFSRAIAAAAAASPTGPVRTVVTPSRA
jgi:predicted MFS family arabinose efflux permease